MENDRQTDDPDLILTLIDMSAEDITLLQKTGIARASQGTQMTPLEIQAIKHGSYLKDLCEDDKDL